VVYFKIGEIPYKHITLVLVGSFKSCYELLQRNNINIAN